MSDAFMDSSARFVRSRKALAEALTFCRFAVALTLQPKA